MNEHAKTNWPLLAGLRFLLALIVLCAHVGGEYLAAPWLWVANLNAFAAVLGFLLISGYSIRASITRDREQFYSRRFDRIAPVYFCAVLLALVPYVLFALNPSLSIGGELPGLAQFAGNFLMVQGILVAPLWSNVPLWTLAVEVLFYALAPMFARMPRAALWVLVAVSLAVNVLRPAILSQSLGWIAPASLLGVWLCGWLLYDARDSLSTQTAVLFIPVVVVGFNPQILLPLGAFTVAGVAWLMIHQERLGLSDKWAQRAIYGGELSYPLYACHYPLLALASLYGIAAPYLPYLLFVASLALSVVVFHGIDKPSRKLRATRPLTARLNALTRV